jgi:hypothetical protein
LFSNNIPVKTPSYDSSQDDYRHEVELKLQQLLEHRYQAQASLQQSINAQAQAQAQLQAEYDREMMAMNKNIAAASPESIAQQEFSQLRPQSQTFPIPIQPPKQEVSSTSLEVQGGWKAQTQAQQLGAVTQNIAATSPQPIPQQDFLQPRPQSQTFPILIPRSQEKVSMTPPEVPAGWKTQWNDQYEEW